MLRFQANSRGKKHHKSNQLAIPHLATLSELRTIAFLCTLLLAGITIVLRIESPVVWTFLGVAISHTLPSIVSSQR